MKTPINFNAIIGLIIVFTAALQPYTVLANNTGQETTTETTIDDEENGPDENDPPPPPDDEDPDAPLDGGVGILIATAVGLSIKKIHLNHQHKKISMNSNRNL